MSSGSFKRLRRGGVGLLLVGLCFQLSYIFVSREALAHRPFEEDTFFHLAVTRNMAMGKGLTIDGVTPTGGAQPGTFVYALAHLAAGFDKWEALRWARLLDVLGSAFSAWMVYRVSRLLLARAGDERSRALSLLSAGLWMASYQVFRINLNGYETVFASGALLVCVEIFLRRWSVGEDGRMGLPLDLALGPALGVAILSRVDLGILAVSLAVVFLGWGTGPVVKRVRSVAIWAALAFFVTLPWWIYNYRLDGSIMPISGKASAFQMTFHGVGQSIWFCLVHTLGALWEIPLLSFYAPFSWDERWWGHLLRIAPLLVAVLVLWRARVAIRPLLAGFPWGAISALLLFSVVLAGYYVVAHGSWWFMKRYLHPVRTLFFCFSGWWIYVCATAVAVALRREAWRHAVGGALVAMVLGCTAVQWAATYHDTTSNFFMPSVAYLQKHHPGARIGAFQSGTLGYFLDNVVNLDGKNNAASLRAVRTRQVLPYMREEKIDVVSDWPAQIAQYCDMKEFLGGFEPVGQAGASTIYRRRPSAVSTIGVPAASFDGGRGDNPRAK